MSNSSLFASLADSAAAHHGLRRTALFLQGLHPKDRDLLMNGVSMEQRLQLEVLQRELAELGIQPAVAAEGMAWRQYATQSGDTVLDHVGVNEEHDVDWLDRIEGHLVCAVLLGEPDALIVRVLRLKAWTWRVTVLDALDEYRGEKIGESLAGSDSQQCDQDRLTVALLRQLRREIEHRMDFAPAQRISAIGKVSRRSVWKYLPRWARFGMARSAV